MIVAGLDCDPGVPLITMALQALGKENANECELSLTFSTRYIGYLYHTGYLVMRAARTQAGAGDRRRTSARSDTTAHTSLTIRNIDSQ
jgi:hypothetical protein